MKDLSERQLRKFIQLLIIEAEILGEPDIVDGRDEEDEDHHYDEVSGGGVPGVALPLGLGTEKQREKKRKDAEEANASGFGAAKPYKKTK